MRAARSMGAARSFASAAKSAMPRRPLHKEQAAAAQVSEALFAVSLALDGPKLYSEAEDDLDGLLELDADEELALEESLRDAAAAEIIQLAAFSWAEFAASLSGPGSRGRYNTWLKSSDFFPVALQSPDRWFRHMFRFVFIYHVQIDIMVNSE